LAIRRVAIILAIPMAVLMLAPACSQATKYRFLSFFFDGVPSPEEEAARIAAAERELTAPEETELPERRKQAATQHFAHAPYRENRCGACHNIQTGGLFRSDREGLCSSCHADLTADARYVHGPVAVRDCLFCHHYHTSVLPHLLLHEEPAICFKCHDPADLTEGSHHADVAETSCTLCHDPHGGDNTFFLRQVEP
jgi:predicted CXXCH cytochrome family protein